MSIDTPKLFKLPTLLTQQDEDELEKRLEERFEEEGERVLGRVKSLREQIDTIISDRRDSLKTAITEWVMFSLNFGKPQLYMDECPVVLSRFDREFVVKWLRDEGIGVRTPRWGGRIVINLAR